MEGLLHIVEPYGFRHEPVEIEAALQVQVDEHREIAGGQAVAVPTALQRTTTAEHLYERQLDGHVGARHAHQHHGAGQVASVERLAVHDRVTHGLDAHIGAVAAGDALHELDRVAGAGVEGVRGTELLGPLELAVVEVDGHDGVRTGQARTGDGGVAHATATEHRHGIAAAHVAGVDGGTDTGHHTATEQACGSSGCGRVDLGALACSHQRLFHERPDAQRRRQLGAVEQCHLLLRVERAEAVLRAAAQARPARAAHGTPVENDVVARCHTGDTLTDRLDDACSLMAQQEREVVVDTTLAVVQVGVAYTARLNGHHGLARARVGDDDGLDRDRLALTLGDNAANML